VRWRERVLTGKSVAAAERAGRVWGRGAGESESAKESDHRK
jgi:hypothetical protein